MAGISLHRPVGSSQPTPLTPLKQYTSSEEDVLLVHQDSTISSRPWIPSDIGSIGRLEEQVAIGRRIDVLPLFELIHYMCDLGQLFAILYESARSRTPGILVQSDGEDMCPMFETQAGPSPVRNPPISNAPAVISFPRDFGESQCLRTDCDAPIDQTWSFVSRLGLLFVWLAFCVPHKINGYVIHLYTILYTQESKWIAKLYTTTGDGNSESRKRIETFRLHAERSCLELLPQGIGHRKRRIHINQQIWVSASSKDTADEATTSLGWQSRDPDIHSDTTVWSSQMEIPVLFSQHQIAWRDIFNLIGDIRSVRDVFWFDKARSFQVYRVLSLSGHECAEDDFASFCVRKNARRRDAV